MRAKFPHQDNLSRVATIAPATPGIPFTGQAPALNFCMLRQARAGQGTYWLIGGAGGIGFGVGAGIGEGGNGRGAGPGIGAGGIGSGR